MSKKDEQVSKPGCVVAEVFELIEKAGIDTRYSRDELMMGLFLLGSQAVKLLSSGARSQMVAALLAGPGKQGRKKMKRSEIAKVVELGKWAVENRGDHPAKWYPPSLEEHCAICGCTVQEPFDYTLPFEYQGEDGLVDEVVCEPCYRRETTDPAA